MLDNDPALYDDDKGEWAGDVRLSESSEAAGGAGGGAFNRGDGHDAVSGGGGGFFNLIRRNGMTRAEAAEMSAEAEEEDGATTSTMAVVSKRRSLSFMFDGVNHYYPDGTPMAPEHFEAGASTSLLNLSRSCYWNPATCPTESAHVKPRSGPL